MSTPGDEHAGADTGDHAKKRGHEDTWDSTCWVAGGGARALRGHQGRAVGDSRRHMRSAMHTSALSLRSGAAQSSGEIVRIEERCNEVSKWRFEIP